MKSNYPRLIVSVSVLSFCLLLAPPHAESELPFPDPEVPISMDYQDARLKDILKIFSQQSGLSFIATEALQDRKITLYLDKVPLKAALDKIFQANNLSYELKEDENIFIVKDWGKPEIEKITRVFYLKNHPVSSSNLRQGFASVDESQASTATQASDTSQAPVRLRSSDIKATLEGSGILSVNGKIVEDADTNSLIVTDVPSRFPVIEQVIAKLDVPIPQVLIDVEMLDVSKDTVDKLGFEFGESPFTLILPGGSSRRGARAFLGDVTYRGLTDIASSTAGAVSFGTTYGQALDFLRTQTDTKYLARPRLLTLSNETAEINIAKDEVLEAKPEIGQRTVNDTTEDYIQGYTLKRATEFSFLGETGIGISLRVTPQINLETNEVTMVIHPKASTSFASTLTDSLEPIRIGDVEIPVSAKDTEKKETKSIVKVKDGETVILGGLIHNDKRVVKKKLPILGDIPFLGALFRHKDQTKDLERELLVFITPHIIRDTNTAGTQYGRVSIPVREQNIGPGVAVNRKSAVDLSLDTLEKVK